MIYVLQNKRLEFYDPVQAGMENNEFFLYHPWEVNDLQNYALIIVYGGKQDFDAVLKTRQGLAHQVLFELLYQKSPYLRKYVKKALLKEMIHAQADVTLAAQGCSLFYGEPDLQLEDLEAYACFSENLTDFEKQFFRTRLSYLEQYQFILGAQYSSFYQELQEKANLQQDGKAWIRKLVSKND